MSGGSYEYIYIAELDTLINKTGNIQDMADRLSGLGYAEDAARETQELLLTLRQYKTRIEAMQNRLSGVWKAVEWWDSCDCREDSVKDALDEYRNPKEKS